MSHLVYIKTGTNSPARPLAPCVIKDALAWRELTCADIEQNIRSLRASASIQSIAINKSCWRLRMQEQ